MLNEDHETGDQQRATNRKIEAFARLGLLDKKVENGEQVYEVTEQGAKAVLAWMGIPPSYYDSTGPVRSGSSLGDGEIRTDKENKNDEQN